MFEALGFNIKNYHYMLRWWINLISITTASHMLISVVGEDVFTLTSVSLSPYSKELYKELQTEIAPSENDPANGDARVREYICASITQSAFFRKLGLTPISFRTLFEEHRGALPPSDFNQIYALMSRQNSYVPVFTNRYHRREFQMSTMPPFSEYVFICPSKNESYNEIIPFYVSKEYNVSPFRKRKEVVYMPGRFVLGHYIPEFPHSPHSKYYAMLAEKAAMSTYRFTSKTDLNVELYYLQMREHVLPVETTHVDPLCRLTSSDWKKSDNQYLRFCVAVFSSPYFSSNADYRREFWYPTLTKSSSCIRKQVSFRTTEGIDRASGKSYWERMILCYSKSVAQEESRLYISRAYLSNQVFVYLRDPLDERIYLENLSTNISIMDELNSFDFIEY